MREVRKHKDDIGKHTKAKEKPSSPERQKQPNDLGATLFGATSPRPDSSNTNPFSMSSQTSTKYPNPFNPLPPTSTLAAKPPQAPAEAPVETLASKLRISSPPPSYKPSTPPEPWPPEFDFPQAFPYLHLEADYETLIPEIPNPSSSKPQTEYSEEDSTFTNGLDKDTDKDLFESTLDKTFLKFSDRLAQNPEQVLRYEWKGTPLLYSSTDAVGKRLAASNARTKAGTGTAATGMPRCEACGAERVFEMQMVPGAIAALEEDDVDLNEGMEWGTVIVGVCGRNCGKVGEVAFREEWCGVQWEERG
jgi:pre-rRNA-processing protein TSR4